MLGHRHQRLQRRLVTAVNVRVTRDKIVTLEAAEADRLCQVAENRWPHWAAEDAVVVPRLFLSPAVLRQDAQGVLENLLHMAAHGLAAARGIGDMSRRGQYHNKKYREPAEEVGLRFDDAGTRGWDDTRVRVSTGDAYEVEVRQLAAALADFPRQQRPPAPPTSSSSTGKVLAMCACPCRRPCFTRRANQGGDGCSDSTMSVTPMKSRDRAQCYIISTNTQGFRSCLSLWSTGLSAASRLG